MKVIHNCSIYNFHKQYCLDIHNELLKRNHQSIIETEDNFHNDADFTIQPDEACRKLGGKGVWIGHALPVIPQNKFYLEDSFLNYFNKNCDYIFTFSQEWKEWHEMHGLPTFNVGMPKLDTIFDNIEGGSILFAPTHHNKPGVFSAHKINENEFNTDYNIIVRGHPAFHNSTESLEESFKKSSIVISDYSSIGLESVILNIPTILIGDESWIDYENNHISGKADEAVIRVYNQDDLQKAIDIYTENPKHLEKERLKYSKIMCDYQKNSAKKFVDTLENLL